MHLAVVEESPLWSLTARVVDHLGGGRTIEHGPWSPGECSMLLLRWFATGWLEFISLKYRQGGTYDQRNGRTGQKGVARSTCSLPRGPSKCPLTPSPRWSR